MKTAIQSIAKKILDLETLKTNQVVEIINILHIEMENEEKQKEIFAIEFSEYCLKNRKALHTTEGLLQIFKKEKGL
jgi:hypothetical protein